MAIDTEAHRYRSYLGITSLVQLSSPDKDWIVDPYPMWSEMTMLNEVFADPKIVKVIHGADNDVDNGCVIDRVSPTFCSTNRIFHPHSCTHTDVSKMSKDKLRNTAL